MQDGIVTHASHVWVRVEKPCPDAGRQDLLREPSDRAQPALKHVGAVLSGGANRRQGPATFMSNGISWRCCVAEVEGLVRTEDVGAIGAKPVVRSVFDAYVQGWSPPAVSCADPA